jgi:preprotein translocase subunit SecB
MDTFPLQLDRYFFTETVVRANPGHVPTGPSDGSLIVPTLSCSPIEGREDAFALELTVTLDESKSENPPYFFSINAFAILVAAPDLPHEEALPMAQESGFIMLIGAIREHLAGITARGPWGPFLFGPMTYQQTAALNQIPASEDSPDC